MSFVNDLRVWRAERNIKEPNYPQYIRNVLEELLEPLYAKSIIPNVVEEIFSDFFENSLDDKCIKNIDINEILDSMNDIQVFTINEIEVMGYDNNLTMNETIKEISSRRQDPYQKKQWFLEGSKGKWQKDRLQDKSTLYTANYEDCKKAH